MPNYLFRHKKTKKIIEVFQRMNEPHVYVDEFGVEWERVFTIPNASIDTVADPYSQKDFLKTTNKKGTLGDLMDQSEEFSQKRKEKDGVDNVREKYYKDWSKKRRGKVHPDKKQTNIEEVTQKVLKKYFKD